MSNEHSHNSGFCPRCGIAPCEEPEVTPYYGRESIAAHVAKVAAAVSPASSPRALIQQIETLYQQATKGPWDERIGLIFGGSKPDVIARGFGHDEEYFQQWAANSALIVVLVNAWPELSRALASVGDQPPDPTEGK